MPTPPMSDVIGIEALDALARNNDNYADAARELGIVYTTLYSRVKKAKERGLHLSSGAQNAMQSAGLNGAEAKGGWIHNYDAATGNKTGTTRWSAPVDDPASHESVAEKIAATLSGIIAIPEIIMGSRPREDVVNLFANSDFHLGAVMPAGKGHRAYNREIAVERVKAGFSELHGSLSPADTAIVLDNGDRLHANDDRDVTVKSGHRLKVEGSHGSNFLLGLETSIWQIEMALTTHNEVIYHANPGNHDPNIPQPLLVALQMRYLNNPRVKIETEESHLSIFQRGRVFISSHHGHGQKPPALAASIQHTFRQQYGVSDFHYLYTGHLHSEKSDTFGGMQWTQLPSIVSTTQYEEEMGFTDTSGIYGASFDTVNRGRFKEISLRL
jgi:hypothetical protein